MQFSNLKHVREDLCNMVYPATRALPAKGVNGRPSSPLDQHHSFAKYIAPHDHNRVNFKQPSSRRPERSRWTPARLVPGRESGATLPTTPRSTRSDMASRPLREKMRRFDLPPFPSSQPTQFQGDDMQTREDNRVLWRDARGHGKEDLAFRKIPDHWPRWYARRRVAGSWKKLAMHAVRLKRLGPRAHWRAPFPQAASPPPPAHQHNGPPGPRLEARARSLEPKPPLAAGQRAARGASRWAAWTRGKCSWEGQRPLHGREAGLLTRLPWREVIRWYRVHCATMEEGGTPCQQPWETPAPTYSDSTMYATDTTRRSAIFVYSIDPLCLDLRGLRQSQGLCLKAALLRGESSIQIGIPAKRRSVRPSILTDVKALLSAVHICRFDEPGANKKLAN
ncbi:hypothetical protein BDY21DRAFT_420926 [Lineolata rhizophorae]|uniref:Uncharacterized protein n=1 Tax=Lineolata rhizophorae TaxID=578093 RepID=A0A6A6P3A8_9PEZI|nr:hypothetical protein BDY21DRAFT_420926 [Lineolata rhizophorae]